MPAEDNQFIFREGEFENEAFHAAAFVSKYRTVCPLEDLKEQLQAYSNGLKHQLYDIINRDYKDFITISTKLDGVDDRVAGLKSPLKDLRVNLSSLHEGILTSMQAIHDKIKRRNEVATKKKLVETLLSCIEQIELTQQIVTASNSSYSTTVNNNNNRNAADGAVVGGTRREKLLSALDRKIAAKQNNSNNHQHNGTKDGSTASITNTVSQYSKDIFIASEYERAAYSLSSVKTHLVTIHTLLNNNNTNNINPTNGFHSHNGDSGNHNQLLVINNMNVLQLVKHLDTQCAELSNSLIQKLSTKLGNMFSVAMTSNNNNTESASTSTDGSVSDGNTPQAQVELQRRQHHKHQMERCYTHCIRALLALNRGDVAEQVLRVEVIDPYIKSTMTAGRIDGKDGRGSYSGLESTLTSILVTVKNNLGDYLNVTESIYAYTKHVAVATASLTVTADNTTEVVNGVSNRAASNGHTVATTASYSGNSSRSNSGGCIDLILNSIYIPITTLLTERYAAMYTIAIANTLSHCYNAVHNFHTQLYTLVDPKYRNCVIRRVNNSKYYQDYQSRWKVDIYYSLRYNEIVNRLDRVCELAVTDSSAASTSGGASAGAASGVPGIGSASKPSYANVTNSGGGGGGSASLSKVYSPSAFDTVYKPVTVTTTTQVPVTATATPSKGGKANAAAGKGSVMENVTTTSTSTVAMTLSVVEYNVLKAALTPVSSTGVAVTTAAAGKGGVSYHYSLFPLFCIELLTTLHNKVLIKPLVARFVTLFLRILVRLDHHLLLVCGVNKSTAVAAAAVGGINGVGGGVSEASKSSDQLSESAAGVVGSGSSGNLVPSTPVKRQTSNQSLLTSPSMNNIATTASGSAAGSAGSYVTTVVLTIDELLYVVHDIVTFVAWLNNVVLSHANAVVGAMLGGVGGDTGATGATNSTAVDADADADADAVGDAASAATAVVTEVESPVSRCIHTVSARLTQTREAVFNKLAVMLTNECKRSLTATVKAIAGKYRMTNKPMPDAHSPYVETVMQPLRSFLTTHAAILAEVFHSKNNEHTGNVSVNTITMAPRTPYPWVSELVQDVTVFYTEQVKALLDSVRTQDEALNRRNRNRPTTTTGPSDTDKILHQLTLDVTTYGREVLSVTHWKLEDGQTLEVLFVSFGELRKEVETAKESRAAADNGGGSGVAGGAKGGDEK